MSTDDDQPDDLEEMILQAFCRNDEVQQIINRLLALTDDDDGR